MSSPTTIRSFSDRRTSLVTEHFKTFSASLGQVAETCLKKSRWMGVGKPDIATAVSASGWLAATRSSEVRLHRLEDTAKPKKFSVGEEIRAVALSEDLLAIVTHTRLLVYEYRENGDLEDFKVEERRIDQDGYWTPRSVAVLQAGDKRAEGGALAWIAVGGEGENGVKVFSYTFRNCWNSHAERMILGCPYNNGAVKLVGFSPCRSNGIFGVLAFAVTTENQIYCWNITGRRLSSIQTVDSVWRLDCNVGMTETPHQGTISSANIFRSPSGRPYLFCTTDRKPGSHLMRSFIIPIDEFGYGPRPSREQIRELPDTVVDDNVLAGVASLNGHFLITVEPGKMRLLTLKGAFEGGLTCLAKTVDWHSSLKGATADISGISISVKEHYGGLEIVAVDGRRNIITARISVPNMPAPEKYVPLLGRRSVVELPHHAAIRELSSDESSRHSVSTATIENPEDRIELVAG